MLEVWYVKRSGNARGLYHYTCMGNTKANTSYLLNALARLTWADTMAGASLTAFCRCLTALPNIPACSNKQISVISLYNCSRMVNTRMLGCTSDLEQQSTELTTLCRHLKCFNHFVHCVLFSHLINVLQGIGLVAEYTVKSLPSLPSSSQVKFKSCAPSKRLRR